jgi:hypothetical protein
MAPAGQVALILGAFSVASTNRLLANGSFAIKMLHVPQRLYL